MDISPEDLLQLQAAEHKLESKRIQLDPVRTVLKDVVNPGLSYTGFSTSQNADENSAVWKIMRSQKSGNITKTEWAGDYFSAVWADRASIFAAPVGPFLNQNSIFFDGVNDFMELVADPAEWNFERTVSRSFSCWVKFASLGATTRTIAARHSSNRGWRFYYEGTTQRLRLVLMNAAANHCTVQCDTALVTGQWYHLAWTYGGTSSAAGVTIYIDGAAQATTTISNNLTATIIATSAHKTQFGARGQIGSPAEFLQGHLDEISFFQTLLTGAEILQLYNAGEPGDLTQLASWANAISWFRMGDGDTFPTIIDEKSGYIAAMQNMVAGNISSDVA